MAWAPAVCFLYFLLRYHSPGYLAGGMAVLGGFHFILWKWTTWGPRMQRLGPAILALVCLALPVLGAWQFLQSRDLGDLDQTSYATALWNFRHGNLHYAFRGLNMLGVHSQYTSVFWIPVQWITGELGLKLGKGLCLLAAVLLAVRRFRGNPFAAWGGIALLLAPPVASQFCFGFHPEFIAAPVLVLALMAYRDGKLGLFLACTAFLAYSKEVFTLAIGGILLVALLEKRPWKWIAWPGALCCVQMFVYWFVILPHFAPAGNHLGHYMPAGPAQIASTWLRPQSIFYILHVFLPWIPILIAYPKRYLLLPLPLMAFYMAFPDSLFLSMWPNYAFPLAFLCAGGLLLGDGGLRSTPLDLPLEKTGAPGSSTLDGRILLACAVASLLCYPLWREVLFVPAGGPTGIPAGNQANWRDVDRMQASLPGEAAVLVNAPFTASLAARKDVSVWGWRTQPLGRFEYVVVDSAFSPPWLVDRGDLARGLDSLSDTASWSREYARDGIFLFRNKRGAVNPVASDPAGSL